LPDPDRPGGYFSFATAEEGQAWFAARVVRRHSEVVAR
jgi:hypothetical protein